MDTTALALTYAATSAGGGLATAGALYLIGELTATGRHHQTPPPRLPAWLRRTPQPRRRRPHPTPNPQE